MNMVKMPFEMFFNNIGNVKALGIAVCKSGRC